MQKAMDRTDKGDLPAGRLESTTAAPFTGAAAFIIAIIGLGC